MAQHSTTLPICHPERRRGIRWYTMCTWAVFLRIQQTANILQKIFQSYCYLPCVLSYLFMLCDDRSGYAQATPREERPDSLERYAGNARRFIVYLKNGVGLVPQRRSPYGV
jgi:hypothetical protein